MTASDVAAHVARLDSGIVVAQRPDGGWELALGGIRVGIAPNPHSEALRRCLEDGVKALGLMTAPAPGLSPDAEWRASVERRLAALERLTRPGRGNTRKRAPDE